MSVLPDPPPTALIDDAAEPESDVRWLRKKAFSQWDEVESSTSRGKVLFLAALALTVLFGVVAYTYWPSRDRNIQSLPANASVPSAAAVQQAQPAPVESGAPSTPERPPAPESAPIHAPSHATAHKLPSPHRLASAAPTAGFGDGSQELLLAEQSLEGKNGVRDSAQAAKLLWKAVGKQNAQASLLLSDLYARGDGVARNCDQARLLLVAAARKGTPAAAQQLHSLESSGCR
jgi:TPR repeat protein